MFSLLQSWVPVLYVRISASRLIVRHVQSGAEFDEVPEMAIGMRGKRTILAVGGDARSIARAQGAALTNPFAHPRSLICDFTVAERILKQAIRRVLGRTLFAPAPYLVIHPQGDPQGGFTQVEVRAFREMGLGAGASLVVIWQGRALTDQELLDREFPAAEGQRLT